jgi:hypothetical protein
VVDLSVKLLSYRVLYPSGFNQVLGVKIKYSWYNILYFRFKVLLIRVEVVTICDIIQG